jgi:glycosyltransferase involved in cell wall biosynthesis
MSQQPTMPTTPSTTAPLPVTEAPTPVTHQVTEQVGGDHAEHAPLVTVVLPCYNEQAHVIAEVERICAAMDGSGLTYELLAIDDASTDDTLALLEDALHRFPHLRLMPFRRNGGSGTARRIGTTDARGEIVVWTDADMTYPNDRIPELVKELEGHDQVVGARTSEQGTAKALRVPAKWAIRMLAQYLAGMKIPDLNSGLRAFRRSVAVQYLHLLPAGFSCVTTITMAFLANGYSVRYVPIEYRPRAGESKFHWWKDTRRYLLQVVRLVLSYNPLKVFLPLGLTLLAVGMAKLGFDLVDKDWRVGSNTSLLLFAAFQVIAIGLLADLVVRVTKPREEVEPASL